MQQNIFWKNLLPIAAQLSLYLGKDPDRVTSVDQRLVAEGEIPFFSFNESTVIVVWRHRTEVRDWKLHLWCTKEVPLLSSLKLLRCYCLKGGECVKRTCPNWGFWFPLHLPSVACDFNPRQVSLVCHHGYIICLPVLVFCTLKLTKRSALCGARTVLDGGSYLSQTFFCASASKLKYQESCCEEVDAY